MREKYESLALVQLKELAKVRGLKGTSSMKKADLVEAMLAEDERVKQKESLEKEAENPQNAEPAPEQSAPRKKTVVTNTRAAAPRQRERMDRNQNGTANGNRRRTERREVPADGSGGFASQSSRPEGSGSSGHQSSRPEGSGSSGHQSSRPEGSGSSGHQSSRPEGSGSSVPQTSRPEGGNVSASQVSRPEGGSASASLTSRPEGGSISASQVSRPEGGSVSASQTSRPEGSGALAAQSIRPDAAQAQRTGRTNEVYDEKSYPKELDSGEEASGILEVMPDGYGFIRCANYMPGENDVYVAPSQIRRFGLKTGDILRGNKRVKTQQEKFSALLFIRTINGYTVEEAAKRKAFEDMTPIFPDQRIRLETPGCSIAMRAMDLVSPVGKGQRGMIVSPPKAGKTTLLKEVAKSILRTNPHMHMLILLIDERPEEVTDIKEAISGSNVEVIYSTFDELPEHHKRVSEMVIERAKRLVEHKKEVVILLDSITRLARAYNLVVPPSGRTLSGGLDPAALHMPKRFFGAARNMREGGSLTILATALVDTGSKMDDVIYEEFKGTGNMELILDRKLSEKRIFPAIDLAKSGTRREDLLLNPEELDAINIMRKALNGLKADEAADRILEQFTKTRNNNDFVQMVKRNKFI
jgi:transcription termination factor Rho